MEAWGAPHQSWDRAGVGVCTPTLLHLLLWGGSGAQHLGKQATRGSGPSLPAAGGLGPVRDQSPGSGSSRRHHCASKWRCPGGHQGPGRWQACKVGGEPASKTGGSGRREFASCVKWGAGVQVEGLLKERVCKLLSRVWSQGRRVHREGSLRKCEAGRWCPGRRADGMGANRWPVKRGLASEKRVWSGWGPLCTL